MSCHGNQGEILGNRQKEFKRFLQRKIEEKGGIRITKMAGIFVCGGQPEAEDSRVRRKAGAG